MRYLIISYVQVPTRTRKRELRTDEIVAVSKNLKKRDLQTASVILDFQLQRVEKASLNGQVAPKNWKAIRDFYYPHYSKVIDDLELAWGHNPGKVTTESTPDTETAPAQ